LRLFIRCHVVVDKDGFKDGMLTEREARLRPYMSGSQTAQFHPGHADRNISSNAVVLAFWITVGVLHIFDH